MSIEMILQQQKDFIVKRENFFRGFTLQLLEKKTAEQYVEVLVRLVAQIPLVPYTKDDILAESKGETERVFYGKWEHSLVVFDQDKPIAVVIAYERKAEENAQYPRNTIYISELAVDKKYQGQGIARKLLEVFFEMNNIVGLLRLDGETNFSIQTNAADWNEHVQNLYKSFGFTRRAEKIYPNRTDVVLGWTPTHSVGVPTVQN